ncbi:hypothetical protein [Streptomyces albipurpureus]|uniref:SpdD protein n=1 Tax=Streptomyces albipurpureus TaxID=2897419 RepID=A0ABT0V2K1_9ACTN|nr:hypothetical protein [Streptomyces sp. CWNU-1]MCM2393758.1 hypothetical protein [Streptomyces sp. CWNU-1]
MSTTPNQQPERPPSTEPFLPLHTAVVLLAALVVGLVIGWLTALTGAPAATAVISGLTAAGISTPTLRSLIR